MVLATSATLRDASRSARQTAFAPFEDDIILNYVREQNSNDEQVQWTKLAKRFPTSRTASMLRCRHQRLTTGDKERVSIAHGTITKKQNKCILCGKPRKGHVCSSKRIFSAPNDGKIDALHAEQASTQRPLPLVASTQTLDNAELTFVGAPIHHHIVSDGGNVVVRGTQDDAHALPVKLLLVDRCTKLPVYTDCTVAQRLVYSDGSDIVSGVGPFLMEHKGYPLKAVLADGVEIASRVTPSSFYHNGNSFKIVYYIEQDPRICVVSPPFTTKANLSRARKIVARK